MLPRCQIKHDRSPRQTPDVGTGSFDRGHHVVGGLETSHVFADLQHAPEGLVASYQDVVPFRGVTVLGVVDLLVCAVHARAQQYLDQNASSIRNVVHPGCGRSTRSESETTSGTSKSRARQWNISQASSACRYLTPLMSSRYRPGPRPIRMRALSHEAQRTIVPMSCP